MNEKIKIWPDYSNSIANLPNSIMNYFGVPSKGAPLPCLDKYLDKEYKNVVVILLDGLGVKIMEGNLPEDGFLRTNLKNSYSSVFPPTTAAATTSIMSGLMPCEHAWLGWDCYYPQIDKNVTVFFSVIQGTMEQAADYHVPNRYTGYDNFVTLFEKAGKEAHFVSPFSDTFPDSFEKITERIRTLCNKDGRKYIYAYWDQPDSIMHHSGCYSEEAKNVLKSLDEEVKALCGELTDTLVIVTADHGHVDTPSVAIKNYPKLMDCLIRLPSIEPRALSLFVKPDKKEEFEEEFNRLFGDDFVLMTKEEVLENKIFGPGKEHECFRSMLGDYLAVATGNLTIFNTQEEVDNFISVHAGLTPEEMMIPLIVVECK